MVIPNKFSLYI